MSAIFKREFRSYMNNVIDPVIVAILLAALGVMLAINNVLLGSVHFEYSMSMMQLVLIVAIPVLAMRPVAEERRSQVERWMRSLPLRPISIVLGRYFAALCVFAIACAVMAVYPIALGMAGLAAPAPSYTALVAFFLLGAALLALCMFLSSLTESQIIAAVVGVGGVLLLNLMDTFATIVPGGAFASLIAVLVVAVLALVLLGLLTKNLRLTGVVAAVVIAVLLVLYVCAKDLYVGLFYKMISGISLFGRFTVFSYGIFDITTLIYDISFSAFFLYLTYQVLEKKRWS